MPIYEYVCSSCSVEFEVLTSFSAQSMPQCPQCASAQVGRKLSRPAIHFKGSGWYITDSKISSKDSANGKNGANGTGKEEGSPVKPSEEAPPAKVEPTKESSASAPPAKTMAA